MRSIALRLKLILAVAAMMFVCSGPVSGQVLISEIMYNPDSYEGGIGKAKAVMKTAIQHGINFFDNAESYGGYFGESEEIMGEALRQLIQEEKFVQREELIISTKLYRDGDGTH